MKAVVAAFNQEKALVGAFSVIVQLHRLIVYSTRNVKCGCCCRYVTQTKVPKHLAAFSVDIYSFCDKI